MLRFFRFLAQRSNRCLGNRLRYLLGNVNFITVLHSNLEYHLNEWNMEKEWAATALFSLSMKIHNFFSIKWAKICFQVCMYSWLFLQQWKLFIFIFKLILSHWFFLTFRVSLQRKKKAININLNVRKLVDLSTVWSLKLLKVIFHVSNYFWERVVFECYLTCCFHFQGDGSHGNLLLGWLWKKLS